MSKRLKKPVNHSEESFEQPLVDQNYYTLLQPYILSGTDGDLHLKRFKNI